MTRTDYFRIKALYSISKSIELRPFYASGMSDTSSPHLSIFDSSELSLPDSSSNRPLEAWFLGTLQHLRIWATTILKCFCIYQIVIIWSDLNMISKRMVPIPSASSVLSVAMANKQRMFGIWICSRCNERVISPIFIFG